MDTVTVGHNGKGTKPRWHLEQVRFCWVVRGGPGEEVDAATWCARTHLIYAQGAMAMRTVQAEGVGAGWMRRVPVQMRRGMVGG